MTKPGRVRPTGTLYSPVLPDNTVLVTRPSVWGNPFKVGREAATNAEAVRLFEDALLTGRLRITTADARSQLAGLNLACWCKPDQPCHADVLLRHANEYSTEESATGSL